MTIQDIVIEELRRVGGLVATNPRQLTKQDIQFLMLWNLCQRVENIERKLNCQSEEKRNGIIV